jgi:hypothetical protein
MTRLSSASAWLVLTTMFDPKLQHQLHKELLDDSLVRKFSNFTSKKNIRLKNASNRELCNILREPHSESSIMSSRRVVL